MENMKLLLKWWKRAIGNIQKETKPYDWWKKNEKHENYKSKILFKQWKKGNGKHEKGKQNYVQVMKKREWKTWK